jgi:hypothetical protein
LNPLYTDKQASLYEVLAGFKIERLNPMNWTLAMAQASLSRAALLAIATNTPEPTIGVVLQQFVDEAWNQLAFYTHKLSPTKQKYNPYDRGLLAIVEAIRNFSSLLRGSYS